MRLDVFEILEDLGGIENLEVTVDQHWDLALRIDAQDFRMLWRITLLLGEGDHDQLEVDVLLVRSNLNLGAEHAQGGGEQPHLAAAASIDFSAGLRILVH